MTSILILCYVVQDVFIVTLILFPVLFYVCKVISVTIYCLQNIDLHVYAHSTTVLQQNAAIVEIVK